MKRPARPPFWLTGGLLLITLTGAAHCANTGKLPAWQALQDPLLHALIADAQRSNAVVLAASLALDQALAQRDLQTALLGPSLSGSASVGRNQIGTAAASNAWQVGVTGNWPIDAWGSQHAALAAAQSDVQASHAALAQARLDLAAEVALALAQWRGLQTRLGLSRSNLDSQLQTLQISLWRKQAGLVTGLDTAQARTAAQSTQAQLPDLVAAAANAEHHLAVLTGRSPDALGERLLASVQAAPPRDWHRLSEAWPTEVPPGSVMQRADVLAAQARVQAAHWRWRQAEAARLPQLSVDGSLGLGAATLGGLGQPGAVLASVLARAVGALWDGGAAAAQSRAQQALWRQAQYSLDATMMAALQEARDALVQWTQDRQRQQAWREAASSAGQAESLARQRYAGGLTDLQVVLNTQRSQLATQDSLASTEADLDADLVRLLKALGSAWVTP